MTKEELHSFAEAGIAQRLSAIEKELAVYHKEWPGLFISATAPQLLKATPKNGSNGQWPIVITEKAARWTPERRAKQAELMRRRRAKELHAAKAAAKAAAKKTTRPPLSAATRRKLALAMKRRHASGEIAAAKAKAAQ